MTLAEVQSLEAARQDTESCLGLLLVPRDLVSSLNVSLLSLSVVIK